jgi:hypothetical protein
MVVNESFETESSSDKIIATVPKSEDVSKSNTESTAELQKTIKEPKNVYECISEVIGDILLSSNSILDSISDK